MADQLLGIPSAHITFALARDFATSDAVGQDGLADRVSERELSNARFSAHPFRKPPTRNSERAVPR
jgi:hypothetical protein